MACVDWGAIRAGASLGLVVVALTMAAFALADRAIGIGWRSNWVFLFYAFAFTGMAAGGRLAARRRPKAALVNGVLAALAAYAVVVACTVVAALLGVGAPDPVALAFNGLMAASAGILGTLVAERGTGPSPGPDATSQP